MTPSPRAQQGPLVSICIPAYNAAQWIGEAVESALAQTWQDFELVVCDDASTDATLRIARSYSDPRLRVEANDVRLGKSGNQNRTIAASTGHYLKFLHADDKLLPTCVEEMATIAQEDEQIGLVFAPREVETETTVDHAWQRDYALLHGRFEGLARVNDGRELFRQLLRAGLDENWIGEPTAVLVSRRALGRRIFNEQIRQIEDLDLWLRIMLEHRVGFIERPLCVYRHHSHSQTAVNQRKGRDWLDRLWLLEGLLEEALDPDERDEVERLRRAALRRAARSQLGRLARRRFDAQFPVYLRHRVLKLAGRSRWRDTHVSSSTTDETPR